MKRRRTNYTQMVYISHETFKNNAQTERTINTIELFKTNSH